MSDPKAELIRYLQDARDAMVWKLDGLSEYDVRRPMVPSGTNLLGLIKHIASTESGYFGEVFDRPYGEELPWLAEGADPSAEMWATANESREWIIDLYRRVWAHSDATISELPLNTLGQVPWWPSEHREVTLHRVIIHMIAETDRHAGHADIIRELIDGAVGVRRSAKQRAAPDQAARESYVAMLEEVARAADGTSA